MVRIKEIIKIPPPPAKFHAHCIRLPGMWRNYFQKDPINAKSAVPSPRILQQDIEERKNEKVIESFDITIQVNCEVKKW